MSKLKSRKFWVCISLILGSVATAIAGFTTDNEMIILVGVICGALSGAIYQICETVIDCEHVEELQVEDSQDGESEATREVIGYSYGTDTVVFHYDDGTSETFRRED